MKILEVIGEITISNVFVLDVDNPEIKNGKRT